MTVHLFVKLLLAKPATLSLAFITVLVAAEAVVQSNGSLILADASHGA